MAQWGVANQAVTVNSITTKETSKGAPMGTWGLVKGAKSGVGTTPITAANAFFGNTTPGSKAAIDLTMFMNATPNAFVNNMGVSVMSVNSGSANTINGISHAGWVVQRSGTGDIKDTLTFTQAAQQFANGESVTISPTAGVGIVNSVFTVSTNATGNVVSMNRAARGSGWANTTNFTYTWNHDVQWVANVQVTGAAVGYVNGNYIVISNGTVNAICNISTNSLGGVTNSSLLSLLNTGLFQNSVGGPVPVPVLTVSNTYAGATGALGNVVTTSFTLKLANSGATVPTLTPSLGGRAGRVTYETLIAGGTNV